VTPAAITAADKERVENEAAISTDRCGVPSRTVNTCAVLCCAVLPACLLQVVDDEASAASQRHFLDSQQYHSESEWYCRGTAELVRLPCCHCCSGVTSCFWAFWRPACLPSLLLRFDLLDTTTQPDYLLACLHPPKSLPYTYPDTLFSQHSFFYAGIARYERMFGTGFISPGGKQAHQVGGQVDGGQYRSVPR
jgi:hypothetical protein